MRTRIQRAATIALIGTILLMWMILLGGCSYARYEGDGHTVTVARSFLDTNIASAAIVKPDGTRIELHGYRQKVDADAVGAAVTAALKAISEKSEVRSQKSDNGRVARATVATDNGPLTTDSHRRGAP
jgi:hypothetical protein